MFDSTFKEIFFFLEKCLKNRFVILLLFWMFWHLFNIILNERNLLVLKSGEYSWYERTSHRKDLIFCERLICREWPFMSMLEDKSFSFLPKQDVMCRLFDQFARIKSLQWLYFHISAARNGKHLSYSTTGSARISCVSVGPTFSLCR